MKLALIGYGIMGQLIGNLAVEQGHEITLTLEIKDARRDVIDLINTLHGCDVALDFSIAEAVPKHAEACAGAGVPIVVGATGWLNRLDDVKNLIAQHDGALIYAANFSVGVQLFYRIAAGAAELFQNLESYDAFIEEAHHKRKRDAPSGTALKLGEIVAEHLGRDVPISSTRAGHIPGTHRVGFDSRGDHIVLEHAARSREGFAAGALLAAEWIVGRTGFYEFSEVFGEIISQRGIETQR